MRIYFGSVDGTGAISACQTLNPTATASGFQTVSKISTMMAISRAEDASATTLFIGGYRSSSCLDVGVALSATCTLLTSLKWTDGYTTGTDAFQWTPGQPDNQGQPGSPQMYLDISTVTGLMDDEWGGLYWDGVVCGMVAERY